MTAPNEILLGPLDRGGLMATHTIPRNDESPQLGRPRRFWILTSIGQIHDYHDFATGRKSA